MIKDKDRSGWFGASDTRVIMGNWKTETFRRWWLVKLGITENTYSNSSMRAGNAYEHKILDALGEWVRKDRQVKKRRYRVRVNLDGETRSTIYEVKTHAAEKAFKVSKSYWEQVQVQMWATGKHRAQIVSYGLTEDDKANYFHSIERDRIERHNIEYEPAWIEREYLPRVTYLAGCLRRKEAPREWKS